MAKTEVATVGAEPKNDLPDYLKGAQVKNVDNFDQSDVALPRIKLLQGASDEVAAYDTANAGNFWHTGMDLDLGPNFNFVVADRRKKYLIVAPLADGQGILARADDAKTWDQLVDTKVKIKNVGSVAWKTTNLDVAESGALEWGTYNPGDKNSPPMATLFYDYLVFLPDRLDLGPAIMSVARTAIKRARKGLNDKIKMQGDAGRPMQSLIFSAGVTSEQGDEGGYYNWIYRMNGFVQDKALFDRFLEYRGALANVKIQDEADTGEPDQGAASVDDGTGAF